MLNGKAKEGFEKWLMNGNDGVSNFGRTIELTRVYFLSLKKTCQQALIIEWFDSVGIYINIENLYYQSWWSFKVKNCPKTFNEVVMVSTRTEATTKAIEKSVEIFNQLNK
jgi:hypothetical protein